MNKIEIMKSFLLALVLLVGFASDGISQSLIWANEIDTSVNFSSPRAVELTGDGTLDIVIGGGRDGVADNHGVNALDGLNGNVLWSFPTEDEMFSSATFYDISGDGIKDVFIGGRYAEFYAINGATGAMIWEFFPYSSTVALDSGWANFYSAQLIPDQNSDGRPDLLLANGGDHSAPPWDTLRPPGKLMVLDLMTGSILAQDTMPDGEETYCSPVVVDFQNNGTLDIVFGSGGENDGGALWRVPLTSLMANDISGATELVSHPTLGFIAPVSIADLTGNGLPDIVSQAYDGTIYAFDGSSSSLIWSVANAGTESSAAPVIANFTGDITPDVFAVLAKGSAPSYFDYYQVLIDGATGSIVWKDSISDLHFASANAVDLNADGRDEALVSLNFHNGTYFEHQLMTIDFENNVVAPFYILEPGVNLGSTPLIDDLDADGELDFVFAFRSDSINPMGPKGFKVRRLEGPSFVPGVEVAWGSYMGSQHDGHYNYLGFPCGTLNPGITGSNISCNGFADGYIAPNPSGGIEPYTFLWSTGEIVDSIGGLDVGSYQARITDSTGCYVDISLVMSDPYVISFSNPTALNCPGDSTSSISVNSSGCPCMFSGCLFDWDTGDSTKNATGAWAGWQHVVITHTDGCIVLDSVWVAHPYEIMDSATVVDFACATDSASGSIELHLADLPNTTMVWSHGDSTDVADSLGLGTYIVQLSDTRGCFSSDTFNITAPDTLLASVNTTDVDCNGNSTGSINSSVTGGTPGYTYLWSNSATNNSITSLSAGSYDLEVTDSMGCVYQLNNILITEPSALTSSTSVWPDSTGTCSGGGLVVATGGTPNYSYLWNDGGATTDSLVNGLCLGTYVVTITDANGCTHVDSIIVENTVGIDNDDDIVITAYPNPVKGSLIIERTGNQNADMNISIFDIQGREIHVKRWNSERLVIDLNDFAPGYYNLIIKNDDFQKVKRFLKE